MVSVKALHLYLRQDEGYSASARVLPLGLRGGVPDESATVSQPKVLRESDPLMARQTADPRLLLLPRSRWPSVLKTPYIFVDRGYGAFVKKGARSGSTRCGASLRCFGTAAPC